MTAGFFSILYGESRRDPIALLPARLTVIQRSRAATDGYPRQFWLLFWGILISSSTGSMVWPFMTIYLRERLQLPLTTVTLLLTLNGLMGMAATFVAGPVVDRFRRKGPMVVMTVGEMILVPTATTLTADLSPSDLRGRYMSIYSLTWSLGFTVGPVAGGYLNDNVAPVAIWYGGMAMALLATAGFAVLSRVKSSPVPMDA